MMLSKRTKILATRRSVTGCLVGLAPALLMFTTSAAAQESAESPFANLPDCPEVNVNGLCRDETGAIKVMRGDTVLLSPVSVWGDRLVTSPGAVSFLSAAEITDLAPDHPAELLNTLPGVNVQMNSGQEHLIAVRSPVLNAGAGQGSFLILENGVPTRSPAFGNVNSLFEPHFETAGAIEVVRGPGSAKYGSNAVHGLINVILAEPAGEALTELRASASSLGRYKADLSLDQGYLARGSFSVQKDNGWRDNSGSFQLKGSGVVETVFAGWDVTAFGSFASLEQETAGFIEGPKAYRDEDLAVTNPNPEAFRDAWSVLGAVRLERELGEGTLSLTPFARAQEMTFRQHFLPYKGFEENNHQAVGLMARYERAFGADLVWRLGLDTDLATGDLKETQPEPFGFFPGDSRFPVGVHYDYSVDTIMGALWSELQWQVSDRVSILAGLRAEAHDYDYSTDAPVGLNGRFNVPADRSDDFAFVTPKLGVIWDASDDLAVYANYARGSRAPQASDLYRLQSLQGVAEADVETLDSFEVGVRGAVFGDRLFFDVAAYTMDKDNYFFRDADGINVADGSTRHQGLEAAYDWTLNDQWSVRGNVAWSDQTYTFDRVVNNAFEIITDGNEIDTAPEWLADLAIVWTPTDAFETALSVEHVGEYFTNPANTQDYPGHTVFHLRADYTVSDTMTAYVIARNLFDLEYADRADFAFGNERYFPGEPLNVTFGIRKTFK